MSEVTHSNGGPRQDVESHDVVIVGAGVSGLATAHYLRRHGIQDVHLIEGAEQAGGAIQTQHLDGFLFEPGPNSLLDNSAAMKRLVSQLGLDDRVVVAADVAKKRYVVRDGRLQPLPMSPPALIKSKLFSWGTKLRLAREPFISPAPVDAEETLEEFVLRRLGREFLQYAIDPFVAGTFAGRPEDLCVRSAFRRLWDLEQHHGSLIRGAMAMAKERKAAAKAAGNASGDEGEIQAGPSGKMLSFDGGLQTLVDALATPCGDQLHTGLAYLGLRRHDEGFRLTSMSTEGPHEIDARVVLLTLPAHAYPSLEFGDIDMPVADIGAIPYPPVTAVFFGYHQPSSEQPLDGFGFLTPRLENRRILGTLWNSVAYTGRAPEGGLAMTTYVGGTRQPENASWSDEEIVDVVYEELRDLMGIQLRPDVTCVHRWTQAIPQYVMGHRELTQAIDAAEVEAPGLFIGGNFRGGISLGDCVTRSEELAGQIANFLLE
ncbi:MAG: protoporphyrinogen oxidase [Gemmatimonadetes bacterium]|nr:protoporphyrinogen oxidase [Gemmatimonadota bacterium]MBT6145061.1 protoporphyrinogen oxidase [Gemmatimonadota bacterium]MBT7862737.1 protoporphyrinogen oxidase [Gemmatimonadota bacterium]